jgi:lysophospholipase L1-like esterase
LGAFERYVALGDSMSIDDYPCLDAGVREPGLGAAALLWSNDDTRFPEWKGKDLRSASSGSCRFEPLAVDGATTEGLLRDQLPLASLDGRTLVTVTAGGNDLIRCLSADETAVEGLLAASEGRLREAIGEIAAGLGPGGLLLVATVYDPTDGTGRLKVGDATMDISARLPLLGRWNRTVQEIVDRHAPRVRLVDVHRHFLGHGITVLGRGREFWYWEPSHIEPGLQGAHEIRRLWWEASQAGTAPR